MEAYRHHVLDEQQMNNLADCRCNECAHLRETRKAQLCGCQNCLRFLAACSCLECYDALVAACPGGHRDATTYRFPCGEIPGGCLIHNRNEEGQILPPLYDIPCPTGALMELDRPFALPVDPNCDQTAAQIANQVAFLGRDTTFSVFDRGEDSQNAQYAAPRDLKDQESPHSCSMHSPYIRQYDESGSQTHRVAISELIELNTENEAPKCNLQNHEASPTFSPTSPAFSFKSVQAECDEALSSSLPGSQQGTHIPDFSRFYMKSRKTRSFPCEPYVPPVFDGRHVPTPDFAPSSPNFSPSSPPMPPSSEETQNPRYATTAMPPPLRPSTMTARSPSFCPESPVMTLSNTQPTSPIFSPQTLVMSNNDVMGERFCALPPPILAE